MLISSYYAISTSPFSQISLLAPWTHCGFSFLLACFQNSLWAEGPPPPISLHPLSLSDRFVLLAMSLFLKAFLITSRNSFSLQIAPVHKAGVVPSGLAVMLSPPWPDLPEPGSCSVSYGDPHSAAHTVVTEHLWRDGQASLCVWNMGQGNNQSSYIIMTVLTLLAFQYPKYGPRIPQVRVSEPSSSVPSLAPARRSVFQAASPVPVPIFPFIWLSVKNAPSLCLPWGKVPQGYFQYLVRTWVISRQFFTFLGAVLPITAMFWAIPPPPPQSIGCILR